MLSVGESYVWKISEDKDQAAKKVPIEEIKKGDLILVQIGEKISVDGTIEKGNAVIDQSAITGEYMPVKMETGQEVFAGTLLKNGNISYEEYMKKNEFDNLIKKYGISFFKEG